MSDTLRINDESGILATIQRWSRDGLLSQITWSDNNNNNNNNSNDADGQQQQQQQWLSCQGTSIPGHVVVTITGGSGNNKSCRYSVASVVLQIMDPNQSLLAYREACKQHAVTDPIRAIDKKLVVAYFLEPSGVADEAAQPDGEEETIATSQQLPASQMDIVATKEEEQGIDDAPEAAAAAAPAGAEKDKPLHDEGDVTAPADKAAPSVDAGRREKDREPERSSSKRSSSSTRHSPDKQHRGSKDHHHKRNRSSSDKDHRHRHRDRASTAVGSPEKSRKKAKTMVSQEDLLAHLDVVVDKRQQQHHHQHHLLGDDVTDKDIAAAATQALQEQITAALSTAGFEVTPEQLAVHKDRTAQILAREIPVGNSASILRAVNPRRDFARVLELYLETVAAAATAPTTGKSGKPGSSSSKPGSSSSSGVPGRASAAGSSTAAGGSSRIERAHLKGKKPVIVVPKGMTTPITLMNAHEFFSNSRFIPRDVMMKQGRARNPPTAFTRQLRGLGNVSGLVEFELTDNPRKLLGSNPHEWDRIVAVIVLGQSWQFKDWLPGYNIPATLFGRVSGFYIAMEGDKQPAEVAGWAVHKSFLNRDKRGLDSVTSALFWNHVDEHMRVHKAELLPQADV